MGVFVLGPAGHCTQPPPYFDSFFSINCETLGIYLKRVILMVRDRVVVGRAVFSRNLRPAVSVFH